MRETWSINLRKEYFHFSCAHFLIFPDGRKERLHGHNYRVSVEIEGELSPHGLVIDFLEAKPVVRKLCNELDERWIVPTRHPDLKVESLPNGHTSVTYGFDRYMAPTSEVLLLPIDNSSVENLATWFGRELRQRLEERFGRSQVQRMRVEISETPGQSGVYVSSP